MPLEHLDAADREIAATLVKGLEAVRVTIGSVQARVDVLVKQFDTHQIEFNRTRETVRSTEIQIALLNNDLHKLSDIFTSLYGMVVVGDKQPSVIARLQTLEAEQRHVVDTLEDSIDTQVDDNEKRKSFQQQLWLVLIGAIVAGVLGFFGGMFSK